MNLALEGIPYIMEGQIVDTSDPDQMGRVKIWVPMLDGEDYDIDRLPWAEYASPLFGFSVSYPAGGKGAANSADAAYGFWAIPKIGATVLVCCLNADYTSRYYFACTTRLHRNRSLPAGRNTDPAGNQGPFGDNVDRNGNQIPLEPAYSNLRQQFKGQMLASEAQTRGVTERQVAQAKTEKDGTEGYSANPADNSYLDPQTYCFVSPGRQALIMQDDPKNARLRLKTADGHQIILDDANERIYISTFRGKTWVEMDVDGHIHVYGSESISLTAGRDINMTAGHAINLRAGAGVSISAGADIRAAAAAAVHVTAGTDMFHSACGKIDLKSDKELRLSANKIHTSATAGILTTSLGSMDIKSSKAMTLTGSQLNLNGPTAQTADRADCASAPGSPSVVPAHEPWKRPASSSARGPNWKA
jgi:phage gp45-like